MSGKNISAIDKSKLRSDKEKKILFWAVFVLLATLGIALRFYNFEHTYPYGWDQTRDAFRVRDILGGNLILEGPRTGVGHFHIGPLWFYLLVPFFFLTNLDPIGSMYLNIIICIATFFVVFIITKKLFSLPYALLAVTLYAFNNYLIVLNRTPWNVSLMPALALLIFYFTYQTFKEQKFKWVAGLVICIGLAFHAHFSAIIFPPMIFLVWLVSPEKKKLLILFLKCLPLYIIWFVPTFIDHYLTNYSDYGKIQEFFKNYFVGVHLQFILHQLPLVLTQFKILLSLPLIAAYFILAANGVLYFYKPKTRLFIKIFFAWLIPFFVIFSVYGGQVSEYYFLFTLPVVYYSIFLLMQWAYESTTYKVIPIGIVILYCCFYGFQNIKSYRMGKSGLSEQRSETIKLINKGQKWKYNDSDIHYYFYLIMKEK